MPRETASEHLAEWGIGSPASFHKTAGRLLGEGIDPSFEYVLSLRRQLWQRYGRAPDLSAWQAAIARWSGASAAGIAQQTRTARRITRYEDAFRRDGLLAPFGVVHSMRAYDWGRAVNVVHWAAAAGMCDTATATATILRVGRLCASGYVSWPDFSAGYSLGRVLTYDEDRFAKEWYGASVAAHKTLTTSPDSPWLTLPWPTPSQNGADQPAHTSPPPPAPAARPRSEWRLVVRSFLIPFAIMICATTLALAAIGVLGWLESAALGGAFLTVSIIGAVAGPAEKKLSAKTAALMPELSGPAQPPARVGVFAYLAMAIGTPSIMFAFLPRGLGVIVGATAAGCGMIARLRSAGPGQVRNRYMANVGLLTGTVAIVIGLVVAAVGAGLPNPLDGLFGR